MGKKTLVNGPGQSAAAHTAELYLTPAQQDYLETIHSLSLRTATGDEAAGARVTDIAAALGTRLPTVVRSIARLRELGLVEQDSRGPVLLSSRGAALAEQLAHRHEDVLRLLTEVLGVPFPRAELDTCVIEHGLSAETAQALHGFLLRWDEARAARSRLAPPLAKAVDQRQATPDFDLLGTAAGSGSRG